MSSNIPEKYIKFQQAYIGFLNHCKIILEEARQKDVLADPNKEDPILTRLNKFMRIVDQTKGDEWNNWHISSVKRIFNQYRGDILSGYNEIGWLNENSVNIILVNKGKEIPSRVHFTAIYKKAVDMATLATKNLEGMPEEEWEKAKELIYPQVLLYHWYRILYFMPDLTKAQNKALLASLAELEEDLQIEQKQFNESGGTNMDAFGGILNMATGLAENLGFKPPDGTSQEKMMSDIGNIVQGPQIQNIMATLGNEMANSRNAQGQPDFAKMISNLVPTITQMIPREENDPNNDRIDAIGELVTDLTGKISQSSQNGQQINLQQIAGTVMEGINTFNGQPPVNASNNVPKKPLTITEGNDKGKEKAEIIDNGADEPDFS